MPTLTSLAKRTRPLTIDLGDGDTLNVVYRPAVYTPQFEKAANDKMAASDSGVLGWMLEKLLVDWDLLVDEKSGKKVPLTADSLGGLPMMVLGPVLEAIGKDMRPNQTTAEASGGGSMAVE